MSAFLKIKGSYFCRKKSVERSYVLLLCLSGETGESSGEEAVQPAYHLLTNLTPLGLAGLTELIVAPSGFVIYLSVPR